MADFTGIQAVTSTLRALLRERMAEPLEPEHVTTLNPDDDPPDGPWVNLFLYRITESAELRNQELPGRGSPLAYGHPPLSLELHYLVTATGMAADGTLGAHRVLGDAMLTLHEHPVIAKDDGAVLDDSLVGEVELLKITLEPMGAEDLSNVWTATTAPYRLSVGYKVTVVQLEPRQPPTFAKPVGEPPDAGPRVYTVPLDRPVIASVGVYRGDFDPDDPEDAPSPVPYARVGDTLAITGSSFLPGTRVLLGDVDATDGVDPRSTGTRLLVPLPDDPALQAGVRRLQLVRDVTIGSADAGDERGVPLLRSNVSAIVVVPTVTDVLPDPVAVGATVTITGQHLVADAGPTIVVIGDRGVAPEPGATATQLAAVVPAVAAGPQRVSVRVNGAESLDDHTVAVT